MHPLASAAGRRATPLVYARLHAASIPSRLDRRIVLLSGVRPCLPPDFHAVSGRGSTPGQVVASRGFKRRFLRPICAVARRAALGASHRPTRCLLLIEQAATGAVRKLTHRKWLRLEAHLSSERTRVNCGLPPLASSEASKREAPPPLQAIKKRPTRKALYLARKEEKEPQSQLNSCNGQIRKAGSNGHAQTAKFQIILVGGGCVNE